jgi:hypothetical protein
MAGTSAFTSTILKNRKASGRTKIFKNNYSPGIELYKLPGPKKLHIWLLPELADNNQETD